jgi:multidrug efflux pump subunit AcrB
VIASFPPTDIIAQILNFGLPAPCDLQVVGANLAANSRVAYKLVDQISRIPGAVDVRVQQPLDSPRLNAVVDRTLASQLGITESQVASSLIGALSGSQQTNPNFWLDPKNGVSYFLNTQSPQYSIDSLDALRNLPILGPGGSSASARGSGISATVAPTQILGNLVQFNRSTEPPIVTHNNIQPVIDIYGATDGKDLGYVAARVQKLMDGAQKDLPRGTRLVAAKPSSNDEGIVRRPARRPCICNGAGLPADGREFPILDRTINYYHSAAAGTCGHRLDVVRHCYHT